ncbi:MAG: thpR [Nocardioides sp.]|nr:thpR [Nocardioides sp.]
MFVALVPPDDAVEHLDEFLAARRDAGEFRWAASGQFHVTLAFLGSVEDRRVDELVERLGRAAARRTGFGVRVAGGGAFPNVGRARVLWAGLDLDAHGETELGRLAVGARAAASRTGIAVDGQRFRPHITLARLGHPAEVTSWVRLLDTYAGPSWVADRVVLIESHLGEGPRRTPRYEQVDDFRLGGAPRG